MFLVGLFTKRFHKDTKGFVRRLHPCMTLFINLLASGSSVGVHPGHSRDEGEADFLQFGHGLVETSMIPKGRKISARLQYSEAFLPDWFEGSVSIPIVSTI